MLNPYVIHKPPPSEINAPVYKPNYSQDTKTVNTWHCLYIFGVYNGTKAEPSFHSAYM